MTEELTALEIEQLAVEMYAAGRKITDIAAAIGKAEATVYWILEKRGVTPSRAKRRSRIVDDATLDSLMELIYHQNQRIEEADTVSRLTELAEAGGEGAALAQAITEVNALQRRLAWWQAKHPRTKEPADL